MRIDINQYKYLEETEVQSCKAKDANFTKKQWRGVQNVSLLAMMCMNCCDKMLIEAQVQYMRIHSRWWRVTAA